MPRDIELLCNGAVPSCASAAAPVIKRLDYRKEEPCDQRIRINIPRFKEDLLYLPPRLLDLVEIAAYVYAVDRLYKRGSTRQVEFDGWSRRFRFAIRVADFDFWSDSTVGKELGHILEFLAGDESYEFEFQPGFTREPGHLFDRDDSVELTTASNVEVALFSGGLDSTAGVLERLSTTEKSLCLVSHVSGSSSIKRTQARLLAEFKRRFPNRVHPLSFECGLSNINRAPEETQRARFLLYSSIALAVAVAYGQHQITVFENGITSIHLRKRQDHLNSRSTRTTHPLTIRMLTGLFDRVVGSRSTIETPYLWQTKTEIVSRLARFGAADLFSSTVSCGKTIKEGSQTHCGSCSQCIDRRIAAYAAGLGNRDDEGLYHFDFAREPLGDEQAEARTVLNDYFFQAAQFKNLSEDGFADERLDELSDVAMGMPDVDPELVISNSYELCRRHGQQAFAGYEAMRAAHSDPSKPLDPRSLYSMVESRTHLRPPIEIVADQIGRVLQDGLRISFQRRRPEHENVLNDEIEALLGAARVSSTREFPHIPFATKQSVPDHSIDSCGLLVEGKIVSKSRGGLNTTNNEMAADLTLYASPPMVLFIVYDPEGLIRRESSYIGDFEKHGRCRVCVVR